MASHLSDDRTAEFIGLFSKHSQRLYRYIRSLMPSSTNAEEVFQNSCAVLWQKFDQFQSGTNFWAWSCQIVRYELLNFRRRQKLERRVFSEKVYQALAERAVVLVDQLDQQHAALAECYHLLTERQKEIVSKIYQPDETTQSVAQALSRTPNAIYKSLRRAHELLFKCIQSKLTWEDVK